MQVVRSESPLFEAYSALLEAVPRGENTACIDGIRYVTKGDTKVLNEGDTKVLKILSALKLNRSRLQQGVG